MDGVPPNQDNSADDKSASESNSSEPREQAPDTNTENENGQLANTSITTSPADSAENQIKTKMEVDDSISTDAGDVQPTDPGNISADTPMAERMRWHHDNMTRARLATVSEVLKRPNPAEIWEKAGLQLNAQGCESLAAELLAKNSYEYRPIFGSQRVLARAKDKLKCGTSQEAVRDPTLVAGKVGVLQPKIVPHEPIANSTPKVMNENREAQKRRKSKNVFTKTNGKPAHVSSTITSNAFQSLVNENGDAIENDVSMIDEVGAATTSNGNQAAPLENGVIITLEENDTDSSIEAAVDPKRRRKNVDKNTSGKPVVAATTKKTHVPPIVINNKEKNWPVDLQAEGYTFTTTITARGYKLKPCSLDEHARIEERLMASGVGFHSFSAEKSNTVRVIASGVPATSHDDFMSNLLATNVPAVSARLVEWTRNLHCQKWVVDVKRGATNLEKLNSVHNSYNHYRIWWKAAAKTKSTLSICRRCCGIGHAIKKCREMIVCVYCAGSHYGNECMDTFIDAKTHKRSANSPKCINCFVNEYDHAHCAIDSDCPTAVDETKRILAFRNKNKSKSTEKSEKSSNGSNTGKSGNWVDLRKQLNSRAQFPPLPKSLAETFGMPNWTSHADSVQTDTTGLMGTPRAPRSRDRNDDNKRAQASRSRSCSGQRSNSARSVSFQESVAHDELLLSLADLTHIAVALAGGYDKCKTIGDQIALVVKAINEMKNKRQQIQ